jgi:hypothetical protein
MDYATKELKCLLFGLSIKCPYDEKYIVNCQNIFINNLRTIPIDRRMEILNRIDHKILYKSYIHHIDCLRQKEQT